MEHEVLLQMTDISKTFPGVKALDKVSLSVHKGTVHALMGENGAGKSTLMKCLFGMYVKDGGHIYLEGREINFKNSREALDNGVAMVHQELNQALKRTVMDNLWLGRYPLVKKGLEREQHLLGLVLYDQLDQALERTIGKRNLALAIDDIFLQVESNALGRADILHCLGYRDAGIFADMEEAVDGCTRGENHRRVIKDIYALTAKLFWGNTDDLNQRVVVDFHTKTLRQFKKRRLLDNWRSRLRNKNFLYIITHIFTHFWSLSAHYRSE